MTDTNTYCRNDPVSSRWTGVGRLLTEFEVDYNFYKHEGRLATLEANYTLTVSLDTITQPAPDQLLFHKTDGSTQGPFTIPVSTLRSRGAWAPTTVYVVDNTLTANGAYYRVLFDHTSGASFDPFANDGVGHDYYEEMIPPIGNALPGGGAPRANLKKSTGADYAVFWGFDNAAETTFTPSTGSTLTSSNVADALEELAASVVSPVVGAVDVTFTPSSGSSLTSTNVQDALEELATDITAPVGYLPLSGGAMTGALTLAADPASSLQAATKQYVDGIASNLGKRQTVRAATTANIVISTALNSGDVIDGVTLATSDLVLVKNQSTAAQNGVYVVEVSPTRSAEFDTFDEHPGALVAVQEGTANADTIWLCTSNAGGTLNTTPIVFSQSSTSGALLAATATLAVLNDVNVTEGAGIDGYALKWNNATGKWIAAVSTGGTTYSAGTGITLTGTTFSVDAAIVAPLASPTFTGTPAAPTATGGTNTTQIATTAFVKAAIDVVLDGVSSAFDTLSEIATALAGKLTASNNLSDLGSAATARTNLGVATGTIEVVIDGGGSTITTGLKGYLRASFPGTLTESILLADQSGSIVVDVWKCTYAQFDAGSTHPVSGDKITASAPPTITTATKSQDATLTGWTTAFSAGDILAFNVNSVSTIQRVTLSLKYTK